MFRVKRVLKNGALIAVSAMGAGMVALAIDAPDPAAENGDLRAYRCPEWLHTLGRVPIVFGSVAASKAHMMLLNRTTLVHQERLQAAVENRPPKTALITVSNHSATIDDPVMFACLMPFSSFWPSKARWSMVSQEYAYTKGGLLRMFFFGAKTLPVQRGGGIDQGLFRAFFDKVQQGKWVHIFPEGRIDQRANEQRELGGRCGPNVERIGHLKWGVGKLIARADVRPVVVPIYNTNMDKIMPQGPDNRLISMIPSTGAEVTIRVGDPITFDDLFEKYRHVRVPASESDWTTKEQEKQLYAAITRRIEDALLALAKSS